MVDHRRELDRAAGTVAVHVEDQNPRRRVVDDAIAGIVRRRPDEERSCGKPPGGKAVEDRVVEIDRVGGRREVDDPVEIAVAEGRVEEEPVPSRRRRSVRPPQAVH